MNPNLYHLLSEFPFETLLGEIPTGLFVIDDQELIVYWNTEAERITGYNSEDVLGRHRSVMRVKRLSNSACIVSSDASESQQGVIESLRHKDGRTITLSRKASVLRTSEGKVLGAIVSFVDITRLQQINTELDAFVSTVSHDLRSPLTPLIGFSDLLEERYADQLDDIGVDCIREIKKTAVRMRNLLEDLLVLARVGQLKEPAELVDMTDIAEEVLVELGDKVVEHRARVKIEMLPAIRLPEPLMIDLFRNLLGNALKYAADSDPHIEIKGEKIFGYIRYYVVDHGPGIAAGEHDTIFEPFRRGHNSRGISGTGIGLATVAKIAWVYGGSAWVEDTEGGGATFIVEFPHTTFEESSSIDSWNNRT